MNSTPFLQAYGLDALLTAQDDPQLWEAALRLHWPAVPTKSGKITPIIKMTWG